MLKKELIAAYLDWVNNYLTTATYALNYGLTEDQATRIIQLGKELHEESI